MTVHQFVCIFSLVIFFSVDGDTCIPRKMDSTPHHAHNSIQRKIIIVISYHLIINVINMSLNEFDVSVKTLLLLLRNRA